MQRDEGQERAKKITHARAMVVLPQLHAPKAGSLTCGCSGDGVSGTSHLCSAPGMPSLLYTHPSFFNPTSGCPHHQTHSVQFALSLSLLTV